MDNSIDDLMSGWTEGTSTDNMFSDQSADDNLFFHEEPMLGVEDLNLETKDSSDRLSLEYEKREPSNLKERIDPPGIFKASEEEYRRLDREAKSLKVRESLDEMLSLVGDYGIVHGLSLFYAKNDKSIKESYGEEEGS